MTYFSCSRCATPAPRERDRCNHCGALLRGIFCRACGLTGPDELFVGDRCPGCGASARRVATAAPPPPPWGRSSLAYGLFFVLLAGLVAALGTCAGQARLP